MTPAESDTPPLLAVRGLRRSYDGRHTVVRDVSLTIGQGRFLTVLGPSGSGKSTLLMMVAGFERPDAGQVLLRGRDITALPAHRRGFGVVFQNHAVPPHLTVAQNVALPLRLRKVPPADCVAPVRRMLDLVRLTGLEDRLPAQLSGGQIQRVALAQALVRGPDLVLMDEPLAALDRALREEMHQELHRLHQALGLSVLYVTHDQTEAMALSDRIAVLKAGVLHQVATPAVVYDRPADCFVAGFVGENNLLAGVMLGAQDGLALVRLACGLVVTARGTDAPAAGPCLVAIRPERITLMDGAGIGVGGNVLAAIVRDVQFLGDHLRVELGIGAQTVVVKRPAWAGGTMPRPGQAMTLAWQADLATAFADMAD